MTRTVQTELINALNREAWMEQARCAGDPEPDNWFPSDTPAHATQQRNAARAQCAPCPVRDTCILFALANKERFGLWGGFDFTRADERRQARQYVTPKTVPLLPEMSACYRGPQRHEQRQGAREVSPLSQRGVPVAW